MSVCLSLSFLFSRVGVAVTMSKSHGDHITTNSFEEEIQLKITCWRLSGRM
jgi:hypothetical protein